MVENLSYYHKVNVDKTFLDAPLTYLDVNAQSNLFFNKLLSFSIKCYSIWL